jgi:hypothetical protein
MDPPFSIWIHPTTRQLEKHWQFPHVPELQTIIGSGTDAVGRDEAMNRATTFLLCPKKQYDIP